MISSSVFIATPRSLDEPAIESADSMSVPGRNGVAKRLPAYSKGAAPITLARLGSFEIKAQTLFSTIDQHSGMGRPRFAIRVLNDGQTVYQRQYIAGETSLLQALTTAKDWIRFSRRQQRWEYIGSFPVLLIWSVCLAAGWLFHPVVGWLSFLPLFVGIPFGWYFAPPHSKSRQTTASLGGFSWDRNDFCRGWLITGDTGAGKTFAINALLHSVFQHEPDWGGLCCDEKGIYHETLVPMARKYGRKNDLLLLQTRPDHASAHATKK
jgi:hypothetical protein